MSFVEVYKIKVGDAPQAKQVSLNLEGMLVPKFLAQAISNMHGKVLVQLGWPTEGPSVSLSPHTRP